MGTWVWGDRGAGPRVGPAAPGTDEPGPAEVKQGLDAHPPGSRHWGPCTEGRIGTPERAGLI